MYSVEYLDPSQDTNWIRFSAFIHHRIPFDLSSSAVHQTPDRAVVLCLDIAPHLYSVVGRSVVASTRVIIITVLKEPCPIPRDKRWPPEHRFIVCLLPLVFGSLEYSVSPRLLLCWPAVQQQSHQITDTLLVRLPRLLLRLLTPLRVHFFLLADNLSADPSRLLLQGSGLYLYAFFIVIHQPSSSGTNHHSTSSSSSSLHLTYILIFSRFLKHRCHQHYHL